MTSVQPSSPWLGKCVEPGHWVIGGRHVRAVYQGRSRKILEWVIDGIPGGGFLYLNDAREWIRNQDRRQS